MAPESNTALAKLTHRMKESKVSAAFKPGRLAIPATHLCSDCLEIFDQDASGCLEVYKHRFFKTVRTLAKIKRNATAELGWCLICSQLWKKSKLKSGLESQSLDSQIHVQVDLHVCERKDGVSVGYMDFGWTMPMSKSAEGEEIRGTAWIWLFELAPVELQSQDGHSPCLLSGPELKDTNSSKQLELASTWLDVCDKKHTKCKPAEGKSWYPTRLVDIKGAPHLVETQHTNVSGPYMALSHCWGREPFTTLTSSNMKEFQRSIPLDKLPQNFQDAIHVARRLDIRYVWIDSLCIIQEGEGRHADWMKESADMTSVYANSSFTLAASRSRRADEGFLGKERDYIPSHAEVFWDPDKTGSRKWTAVNDLLWCADYKPPLGRRAWALQERILANRVLHFGLNQLHWECRELSWACEQLPTGMELDRSMPVFDIISNNPQFSIPSLEADKNSKYLRWYGVVIAYSSLDLSAEHKTQDKLVALAGLAEKFASVLLDTYVAGLFLGDILRGLLWFSRVPGPETSRWRESYATPSWSWAGISSRVDWNSLSSYSSIAPLAGVEDIKTEYRNQANPFGDVLRSELVVSAAVIFCNWENDEPGAEFPKVRVWSDDDGSLDGCRWFFALDEKTGGEVARETAGGRRAKALLAPIAKRLIQGFYTVSGLVLEPVDASPGTYRRAGYFEAYDEDEEDVEFLVSGERQRISII